jgi:hypothetical protein
MSANDEELRETMNLGEALHMHSYATLAGRNTDSNDRNNNYARADPMGRAMMCTPAIPFHDSSTITNTSSQSNRNRIIPPQGLIFRTFCYGSENSSGMVVEAVRLTSNNIMEVVGNGSAGDEVSDEINKGGE